MKRVLLLEPNPYHNEVLPGIVNYFETLEYTVDVLIRKEVYSDNVFCRYKINGKIHAYELDDIKKILWEPSIKKYDFLFFSSMEHCENGKMERFLDFIGFIPKTKYGILGIYHTTWLVDEFNDYDFMNQGRLFCLSEFQIHNYNYKMLNPHFFCDDIISKNKFELKKRFVVIGNSADYDYLVQEIKKLDKNLRNRIEIRIIGGKKQGFIGKGKLIIKPFIMKILCIFHKELRYRQSLKVLGYLNFSSLYRELEKADYILVMIDPNKKEHAHYNEWCTSGTKQLILGFNKICLIRDILANNYGFTDKNSIIYDGNRLDQALAEAVLLDKKTYEEKCYYLNDLSKYIYNLSIDNLREQLYKIKELYNES